MSEDKPTSGLQIDGLGPGRLLLLWGEVMGALQQAGVIRSGNNPVGDICEYLVARHYGVSLAAGSTSGYDLTTQDGLRVQVKGRRRTGSGWPPHFGGISGLDETSPGFDVLVGVVLNGDFTVAGAWRAPWITVHDLATEHGPWGPHRRKLALSGFRKDPRVERFELGPLAG